MCGRSAAPGDSRTNLVADKLGVMNKASLHWALWTYRDPGAPGFGLYHSDELDERLAGLLRRGLDTHRVFLPLLLQGSLPDAAIMGNDTAIAGLPR